MDQMKEVPTHLIETAKSDPDAIDPAEIETLLDDDWAERRNTALKVLVGLAADDTDRAVPFVDDAIDSLDGSYGLERSHAALVLSLVAKDHPDLVEPAIPKLVDNLDDTTPIYRFRTARTVAALAETRPESFIEHADTLVDFLIDGPRMSKPEPPADSSQHETFKEEMKHRGPDFARSAATTEVVANVLVEVAKRDPEACAQRLPELISLLSDEDQVNHTRGGIIEIIRYVGTAEIAVPELAIDTLIDLLNDDATMIRSRAIRTLGYTNATDAVDPLGEVARSDPDEDVRDLAAETANWLEQNA